jgi:hypothetical protein
MDQYFRIFPTPFALLSMVAAIVAVIVSARTDKRRGVGRPWWQTASIGAVVFGLILTLVLTLTPPVVAMAAPESMLDTRMSLPSRPQTVINLLLLWWIAVPVPLLRRTGVLATTAIALGASVAIEVTQALLAGGRSASVMDVLLNTGGALVMATIAVALLRPVLVRLTTPSNERVPTQTTPV